MAKVSGDLMPTRWTLVNRLKNWDDQESWKNFFDVYWRLIYSVALKAGLTESEAQDAVQETVISVAKKMPNFKGDASAGSFRGWLLQITRRRIVDQFRKRAPHGHTRCSPPGETSRTRTVERIPDPAGAVLEKVWNEEWQRNLLDLALERIKVKINPKQFQVFHLLLGKDLPPERVTAVTRINVDNVYVIKCRVSSLLQEELQILQEADR